MNRKSFFILLVLLLLLGGGALLLFRDDMSGGGAKLGAKVFDKLPINDVAQIHLSNGRSEVTLALQDQHWVVKERADYSANRQDIRELLLKLPDLKILQTQNVGATLYPRLDLVAPTKDAKPAEGTATALELIDKSGKNIITLMVGKKIIKTEDSPLPIKPQTPVGRYVMLPGGAAVLVVSDPLNSVEAKPGRWLAKDFFKVDRVKSIAVSGDTQWKIEHEEYGNWKFVGAGGQIDPRAAGAAAKLLSELSFEDVAPGLKPESLEKPRVITADTFDNLVYTIKIAKKPESEDYYLAFSVSGVPPRTRPPEKDEKAEEKERDDKRYVEDLKKLDERLKVEQTLAPWTYVVSAKTLEPLLKDKAGLTVPPRPPEPSKK